MLFGQDEGVAPTPRREPRRAARRSRRTAWSPPATPASRTTPPPACLVVAEDKLAELGLEPMGWFVGWAAAGCDPSRMGIGPVPAVERLFARTGFSWDDIDLVELNEAFAPQVLAVLKGWGWRASATAQRQRLRHFARPSDRRDRRAHPRQPAARAEAPQGQVRPGDHVHRRRPGHRGDLRAGVDARNATVIARAEGRSNPSRFDKDRLDGLLRLRSQ